ncbi:sarcosine oxidase, partial [Pseudomonas syringae pv. tagetis]
HSLLQLCCSCIPDVMSKLCGVDLRREAFKAGWVAETSAARINVFVINVGSQPDQCFQILFDLSSLAYFKDRVLYAMAEFGGRFL